jgi:hypothetical protein
MDGSSNPVPDAGIKYNEYTLSLKTPDNKGDY